MNQSYDGACEQTDNNKVQRNIIYTVNPQIETGP